MRGLKVINAVINYLQTQKIYIEKTDKLPELLSQVETVEEHDTFFSGKIRILKTGDNYLIQEQTPQEELAIRLMNSKDEAKQFVLHRLETYENMWNGCGCRVDYYS
jgi:hypothetical protein